MDNSRKCQKHNFEVPKFTKTKMHPNVYEPRDGVPVVFAKIFNIKIMPSKL